MTAQYGRIDLRIRARNGKRGDGPVIAAILSRSDRRLATLGPAAGLLLDRLLADDLVRAGCIEASAAGGPWTIEAAGLSTFLSEGVAEAYLARPEPHFAARLVERSLAGEGTLFLDDGAIGRANAGAGLNLFILGFGYTYPPESPHVGALLARAIEHFVSAHAGFRLKRLMREDPAPIAEMFQRSGMRTLVEFPDEAGAGAARVATLLERHDINPLFPYSPATALFQFAAPHIGFSRAERRMLAAALDGCSDADLATVLGISPNTVKRTWRAVFDRAGERAPYILGPPNDAPQSEGVRGHEKRRHLLTYLRDNPQELRPYAFPAARS